MPSATSSRKTYRIFVTVYRGKPQDRQHTRHAALFFRAQGDGEDILYHVRRDTEQGWIRESRTGHDPTRSVGNVDLTNISIAVEELHRVMASVPVNKNPDPMNPNSQFWVKEALDALKERGYITPGESNRGFDQMLDITFEDTQD